MKKVGIFTIYICNYGAVLQTYALKKCIESLISDCEVSIVDFYSHEHYKIFSTATNNSLKKLIKNGIILLHYPSLYCRNLREKKFISEQFNLSKRFDNLNLLIQDMPEFDYYLTGSDQVFNRNSKYSSVFFQQFNVKTGVKAAYAPSFGQSKFTEKELMSIKKLTAGFKYLSCREDDGANMLSNIHGRNIPCVVDPTLLLGEEQWCNMMTPPKTNDKYLLVYDLNGGIPMLNMAREIAKDKNLKIYCITRHPDIHFIYKSVNKVIYNAGPREFVGYFHEASYIVTDSFHGTAFSIIFRKNFNTYIAVPKSSQRILSLLEICNLQSRVINTSDIDTSESCYLHFNKINFETYRMKSINYLERIFG